jgi:C4-dicarboxylate anaerobic carrier
MVCRRFSAWSAFLVPSSSGHATLAMPTTAPLGDFTGVSRAMVVTAYQSASGWMNLSPHLGDRDGRARAEPGPLRPVPEVPTAAAGHPARPHLPVHAPRGSGAQLSPTMPGHECQLVIGHEVAHLHGMCAVHEGLEPDGPCLQHSPRLQVFATYAVGVGVLPFE